LFDIASLNKRLHILLNVNKLPDIDGTVDELCTLSVSGADIDRKLIRQFAENLDNLRTELDTNPEKWFKTKNPGDK